MNSRSFGSAPFGYAQGRLLPTKGVVKDRAPCFVSPTHRWNSRSFDYALRAPLRMTTSRESPGQPGAEAPAGTWGTRPSRPRPGLV